MERTREERVRGRMEEDGVLEEEEDVWGDSDEEVSFLPGPPSLL